MRSLLCLATLTAASASGAAWQNPAPAQQPVPQPFTGLVLGTVVDAATGAPVADAVVTLSVRGLRGAGPGAPAAAGRGGAVNPQLGPPGTPPGMARVLTGGDGRFVFRDLPAGNVLISAIAPGYLGGQLGQTRPEGGGIALELADGERVGGLVIRVWKYAVLAGRVSDEHAEPVAGLTVRALRRIIQAGVPRLAVSAVGRTDDRGIYRIANVVPGSYVVGLADPVLTMPASQMNAAMQMAGGAALMEAALSSSLAIDGASVAGGARIGDYLLTAPGLVSVHADGSVRLFQRLFYPAAASAAEAAVITVQSGEERADVDLQVTVVPGFAVRGRVVGPQGPVGMVQVRLLGGDAGAAGQDVASTTTGADGSFALYGVSPGQYVARVVRMAATPLPPEVAGNPMLQMSLASGGPGGRPGPALFGSTGVAVADGHVDGLAIALSEGATIRGRFVFDGGPGSVAPPAQVIQSLTAAFAAVDGMSLGAPPPMPPNSVDAEGRFTRTGVGPGRYWVNAREVGAAGVPWIVKTILKDGTDLGTAPLEVTDADVSLEIVYTNQRATLDGTVRSALGRLVTGASVLLVPAAYRDWIARGMSQRFTRLARTPRNGAYTMGSLLAGEYFVGAMEEGDGLSDAPDPAAFLDAFARVATRIVLAEGERRTLELPVVKVPR